MVKSNAGSQSREITLNPVGYIDSRYAHYRDIPRPHGQKGWTDDISELILYPEHRAKIGGLEGYSHMIILYWIHKAREWRMPRDHGKPPKVRLFATRMPVRPNPIGLSVVEIVDFSSVSGRITVKGLDALDRSPLLDIKPYIPDFDSYPGATLPDWVKKHLKKHHHPD
ncbi:MAG: tRNA (N6-threonylcarbamoyladenosine(37)-N6)-methyltransferase TrmO [Candidatus Omnitrophica bacterium]|nr:tRNA (N6-threonylcarbamoyladenosine(37)-N6)-methyltransferase TrmO [Candidatus Omnitrophota bacterium]